MFKFKQKEINIDTKSNILHFNSASTLCRSVYPFSKAKNQCQIKKEKLKDALLKPCNLNSDSANKFDHENNLLLAASH